MTERKYDSSGIDALAREFNTEGFCVLRNHFSTQRLEAWRQAFTPLLHKQIAVEGASTSRGAHRYYVTLPFHGVFADPALFEDDDILDLVERVAGKDFKMDQLASDTPVAGSEYQDIHRDTFPLFPEWDRETPSFQLAVNFPLVDITADNGPLDLVRRTHRLSRDAGMRLLESGQAKIELIYMNLGDVIVRDVRALHRGTPNRTPVPRPMVVIGYSRKWMFRPEISIKIPRAVYAGLSERARHLLRFNSVVDTVEESVKEEAYRTFAY